MTKWTPGPWKHYDDSDSVTRRHEIVALGKTVARIYCSEPEVDPYNAHLIAAAPELYEALEAVMKLIDDGMLVRNISGDHQSNWAVKQLPLVQTLQQVNTALSKARGE